MTHSLAIAALVVDGLGLTAVAADARDTAVVNTLKVVSGLLYLLLALVVVL